ncbi:hypothetical protein KC723_03545 [Candidatus Kaiserbacteria bacterium]|nr:hypothetical protein [Candidatus Kaiserbacteria bacterium]
MESAIQKAQRILTKHIDPGDYELESILRAAMDNLQTTVNCTFYDEYLRNIFIKRYGKDLAETLGVISNENSI